MPAEVFANVAESTLAVAALSTDPTLTLLSGAPFPATGQYRIRLDDSLQQPGGIATRYEFCRATFNAGNVINGFRTGVDLEGTTAQAWPIGTAVRAIVTAAALANSGAQGTLGYAQSTAGIGSIGASAVAVWGNTAVTVGAGRRIRITAYEPMLSSSVASDLYLLAIFEGATQIGGGYGGDPGSSHGPGMMAMAILTPSAGSHTYHVNAARYSGAGTCGLARSATAPAYFLIEDIGGV